MPMSLSPQKRSILCLQQYYEVLRQRDVLEDQIAVLMGLPASTFCLEHLPLKGLPPCIPEGIPSEALLRRPDVAEAEYVMLSDHALVKQAYSLFFPSLTLTSFDGLFKSTAQRFFKMDQSLLDGWCANQSIDF